MPPTPFPNRRYRGRFAPSPTGPLHLGSLTAALGSWLMARHQGGAWLVRIEDIDPPREVPGMARQQLDALAAFGMVSDEPVLWQSERSDLYAESLERLRVEGLAFECRCSRSDLAASGGIHHACVARPSGLTPAVRLRAPAGIVAFEDRIRGHFEQDVRAEVGDVVLKRSDGFWAYQLAVVVDDALQGISEIVRGADLIDSTPRQIQLHQALALPQPDYAHLPVIRTQDRGKLSKSLGSAPIDPGDPLPALRLAFAWLGQDARELDGIGTAGRAIERAAAAFSPALIPAQDLVLAAD